MNLFSMITSSIVGATLAINSALAGGADTDELQQLHIEVAEGQLKMSTLDQQGARRQLQMSLSDACDDALRGKAIAVYQEPVRRRLDKLIKLHSCERDSRYRVSMHELSHPGAGHGDINQHYLRVAERMARLAEHMAAMSERLTDHMEEWSDGWEDQHWMMPEAPMAPLPPDMETMLKDLPEPGDIYTEVILDLLADGALTAEQKQKISVALKDAKLAEKSVAEKR